MENVSTSDIFQHIARMERELTELRRALLKIHGAELAKRQPGSLRGIWRAVRLEEEDFTEAKASLSLERDL